MRVRMGATTGVIKRSKVEGSLAYALQGDGTWTPFIGPEVAAPILELLGPDRESIALHLQEIRDQLGLRATHNIYILSCVWRSNTCLRVCLIAATEGFPPTRLERLKELADVIVSFNDNEFFDPNWMAKSIILHAMAESSRTPADQESVRELCPLVEEEE